MDTANSRSGRALLRRSAVASLLACHLICRCSAADANSGLFVGDIGPNHKTYHRIEQVTLDDGRVLTRTNIAYTTLRSGGHYFDGQQWRETQESFEIIAGADGDQAVARFGPSRAILSANINGPGAVDFETSEGIRLRSHPLGIAYFEETTQRSIWVALVRDSLGAVAGNQTLYRDALGPPAPDWPVIRADIRFSYRAGEFAQDLLFASQIPDPRLFGFDPNATKVEVITEFLDAPAPERIARETPSGPYEELWFGSSLISAGRAFAGEWPGHRSMPVRPIWQQQGERTFLIEVASYNRLARLLAELPDLQAGIKPEQRFMARATPGRQMPAARQGKAGSESMTMLAALPSRPQSVVWDYTILSGALTNFTFTNGFTFLIQGTVYLYRTNTLEAAILKYTNGAQLRLVGGNSSRLICKTGPYNYAHLVSIDDPVGEPVAGASAAPSGYYAAIALNSDWTESPLPLEYLRFRNASTCVFINEMNWPIRNCQFVDSDKGIRDDFATTTVENSLFHRVVSPFYTVGDLTLHATHVTLRECTYIATADDDEGDPPNYYFTNSILHVTNWTADGELFTNACARVTNVSAFASIGGATAYLADNTYRNAGSTSIRSELLAARTNKTTTAPLVHTNAITANTNFVPLVARDTGLPDLGYGYDPVDAVLSEILVSNAVVTLSNSVVLAGYGSNSLWLGDTSQLLSHGDPLAPNRICSFSSVAERATNWGGANFGNLVSVVANASPLPTARFRFTHFNMPGPGTNHIHTVTTNQVFASLTLRDCEFHGGMVSLAGGPGTTIALTNNLWNGTAVDFRGPQSLWAYNNLFRAQRVSLNSTGVWTLRDNAFDTVVLQEGAGSAATTNSHNSYINSTRLQPQTDTNDIVLTNFTYHSGPLGHFYHGSSSLTNKGSRSASSVHLHWFTVQTNNQHEAETIVDPGYHVIALGTNNLPLDLDGDGYDYLLDGNENGITEPNEVSGLKLWLKADVDVTHVATVISAWADQSGNGNNGSQTTEANKPIYFTNIINGLPVVRFDGTNDSMDTTHWTGSNNFVVLAVLRPNAAQTNYLESPSGFQTAGLRFFMDAQQYGNVAPAPSLASGAALSCGTNGTSVHEFIQGGFLPPHAVHVGDLTDFSVIGVTYTSRQPRIYFNGAQVRVGYPSAFQDVYAPRRLGGFTLDSNPKYFAGDIAEVVVYNAALPQLTRHRVERYLNSRYALVSITPGTPASLSAFAVSSNQISLTWTAGSGQASGFRVERKKTSTGVWQQVAVAPANTTTYFDTNLTASTVYYYRVKAENLAGESDWSNEANATTSSSGTPIPLSALKIWLMADSDVGVDPSAAVNRWADQSGNLNHFHNIIGGTQPVLLSGQVNGRPAVRFDGVDDLLDLSSTVASNDFTVFAMLRSSQTHELDAEGTNGGAAGQRYLLGRVGALADEYESITTVSLGTNGVSVYDRGGGNPVGAVSALTVATNYMGTNFSTIQIDQNSGQASVFHDGTLLRTGQRSMRWPVMTPNRLANSTNGVPGPFAGDLSELMLFAGEISPRQSDAVGRYLKAKYALTGTGATNAPTNVLITALSTSLVTVAWTRASTNESSTDIERRKGTVGPFVLLATLAGGATNYVDTLPDTTNAYFYRLRATNYFGQSPYSITTAPPTIKLTSPTNLTLYGTGTANALSAEATDSDGTVSQVEFFAFTNALGSDATSPYSITWTPTQPGVFLVSARATDNLGNTRISHPVEVFVFLDTDGDGLGDTTELGLGTGISTNDTDGDGLLDFFDLFPTLGVNTNDVTPPTITLEEPPILP